VTTTTAPKPAGKPAERPRRGPVRRLGRFIREVIAELSKVIWPTRKELVTYTIVVIIFVSIMVALVAGLDILFAKGVLIIFG
jgi:preprotein translocase subunit SecE